MFRKNTIKCFAFLFLSLCMAFSFKTDACESAAITGETSLAGMTVYLDRFYSASVKRKTDDRKEQVKAKKNNRKKIKKKSNIYDTLANAGFKYENLGVANVSGALNVHREASESSAVVGKMTKDNGCDIKGTKGKWSHIVSGKVNGYVLSKYLLTGDKAKSRAKSVARLRAIVNTKTLNVRTLPSIDSKITRNFVWVDHGELEIIDDFGAVLSEIIRMLKPKSCLSPEMKELLMNMVKNNSQDKKRNNGNERNNR